MDKESSDTLLEKIKADNVLSGTFGEAIGKAWLEEDGWELLDLNEAGIIPKTHGIYKKDAKKADQIGSHDEHKNVFVVWDQKFHTLYNDFYFRLERKELGKYEIFIEYCRGLSNEDDFILLFMFMPKIHGGKRMCLVDLSQFFTAGKSASFGEEPALQVRIKEENCYDTSKHQNTVLKNWK